MAFDSVPWFVEGGAQHSAEVARLLAHIATGGKEGILNSTDLRVQALSVPATQIRVMPGACTIINRSLGGENQSYVARAATETDINVPASGSSGPRTHLVIARVENPFISGEPWGPAPDLEDGPYIYARLIPDVPISTKSVLELNLGYSAITLARVTVPANTATITNSMITDLRGMANVGTGGSQPPAGGTTGDPGDPDQGDPVIVCPGGSGDDGDNDNGDPMDYTDTTFINWPFNAVWNLAIPAWATTADIDIIIQNVQVRHGSIGGLIRLLLAGIAAANQTFKVDWPGGTCRQDIHLTYTGFPIAANLRGTTQQWRLQAQATVGYLAGILLATPSTRAKVSIHFYQTAS